MFRSILLLAACGSLPAADLTGPVLGYVWDARARAVRPMRGVAGASFLGTALDLGFDATTAAIAPQQDYLLATATDGLLRMVRLDGTAAPAVIPTPHGLPEEIVFSPSGTAAALRTGGQVDVVTGLPREPAIASSLERDGKFSVSDEGEVRDAAQARVAIAPDGRTVQVLDSNGKTVAELACACKPTALVPMKRAYRLTEPGDGPVWLLDLSGAAPRLTFVPEPANP